MRLPRIITTLACTAGLLAALSPAAFGAASVGRNAADLTDPLNTRLSYLGDDTGRDDLTVWVDAGDLWFEDPLNAIDPNHGCTAVTAKKVRCSQQNLGELRIHAKGGNNEVRVGPAVVVPSDIDAQGGSDFLVGGYGTEEIRAGDGPDTIFGGANPNGDPQVLDGGAGNDDVFGGAGPDELSGGLGADVLQPGGGKDLVFGDSGRDRATYFGTSAGVNVTLDGSPNDGLPGEQDNVALSVEDVTGTAHDDHLVGDASSNDLEGKNGTDTLDGRDGGDSLHGGVGEDVLLGGDSLDFLWGGADDDQLHGEDDNDILFGEDGHDMVDGGGGDVDALDGGSGNDDIRGGDGTLDQAYYGGRTQPVQAEIGADGAGEAGENDTIAGDIEYLRGGGGDDELLGDTGPNTLDGGDGADVLDGREGVDRLRGYGGDDTLRSSGDGAIDDVECGDGNDSAQADPDDVLDECEQVDLVLPVLPGDPAEPVVPGGGLPAGDGPGAGSSRSPGAGPAVVAAGPKVVIAKRRVRVGRNRIAVVRLTCPASAAGRCAGVLTLRKARKRLGSRSFSIAAGRTVRVKVRVKRLRRTRHAVRVLAVAVARADGTEAGTSRRTLRFRRTG